MNLSISISNSTQRTPLVNKTIELLERYARQAGKIELTIQPGIGIEGFRIEDGQIIGNDEQGLLYGAGKFLRDPAWRGTSVPEKPIRAIYFASHFHNFYHDAPIEKVCRYIEELALWGCNTLTVWFDMHHYAGIHDPEAQKMVARLRAMLRTAQDVGMRPGLMLLANEGYANSPVELRADWRAGQNGYFREPGGHYHVEICPNQPGGLEQILKDRAEMLDAFEGVQPGFIVMWPYDQGGCTCAKCTPWGANGFLKVAEPLARLLRQRNPDAKLVLSTWYFDHFVKGEWEGLSRAFAGKKPDWADYLLADDYGGFPEYPLQHGMPGGLPGVNFPEISMNGMWPWGGFGANPRPAHWQKYWDTAGAKLAGGFPYSEGIFEDLNKVIQLQLNWSSRQNTHAIVREYAAAEFSPAVADEVTTAIFTMEETLDHNIAGAKAREIVEAGGWEQSTETIYWLPKVTKPERYAAALRRADKKLPAAARTAWRWRILFLRALLDEELLRSGGKPTNVADGYFAELTRIYHADNAEWLVSPVGRPELTRLRDQLPRSTPTPPVTIPKPSKWCSPFISSWRVSKLQQKTIAAAPARSLADPLGWQTVKAAAIPPGFINIHPLVDWADGVVYLANKFRVTKAGCWTLHIGHDGGIRVFVNGRAVLTVPERQNPAPPFRSKVALKLGKGTHEIVTAFDTDAGRGWGIFCSFEIPAANRNRSGKPVFPQRAPIRL
ncbi:MAG: hypothetical protein PCFJNLEI_00892 [Verrucomicrobiae bacterium]|nr:hypothetical protein [Verrucomicrobiae bacterium]